MPARKKTARKRPRSKSAPRRRKSRRAARSRARFVRRHPWWSGLFVAVLGFALYLLYLNWQITSRFEGRRWDLPARVYARPLELYAGLDLDAAALVQELRRLGYRESRQADLAPGRYRRNGPVIEAHTREFRFWDELQPATPFRARFGRDGIEDLDIAAGRAPVVRLDPLSVGSIFPRHGEDRIVVAPEQVPEQLRQALVVVEDRRFEDHAGVDPIALGRAVLANLKAGEVTQGGSTLTQQLVKNYFLDNRRTLTRKLREALMALILEAHYDKPDILNAYINEIYLGQDGQRAIHGFGLASQYYFSQPLEELELHQLTLLVALVRGPGYYDPERWPERAMARRNLVIDLMASAGVIDERQAADARRRPLDTWDRASAGASYYPAYLALVRQQLAEQYRAEDLAREGLRIFTALDPLAQASAERRVADGLAELDARQPGQELAAAAVVAVPQTGDVLALVGDRRRGYEGFNRALSARRPIGSLVKPVVYLAALQSGRYSLADRVEDGEIRVPLPNGDVWEPRNFDNEAHGEVTLVRALAESLNMATVRLGMDVGVEAALAQLEQLGADLQLSPFPSLLLGAVEMTPFQVAQVYATLGNDGFHTPLRAVRAVVNADGVPLTRYPIEVRQAADARRVFQLNEGLVAAMQRGTGRSANAGVAVAGKTGTSDEFRDSWFAGYSGDRVAVVWIGHDDYRPTTLSGASGAMTIWDDIMRDVAAVNFAPLEPPGLQQAWIDYYSGARVGSGCDSAISLSFADEQALPARGNCTGGNTGITERTLRWLNGIFN